MIKPFATLILFNQTEMNCKKVHQLLINLFDRLNSFQKLTKFSMFKLIKVSKIYENPIDV